MSAGTGPDPIVRAVVLLEHELGATVLEQRDPCRRCGRMATAVPLLGDPPGPWCVRCRPWNRRRDRGDR